MHASATRLDAALASGGVRQHRADSGAGHAMQWVSTRAAVLRVTDTGGDKPCVLITPDGPNVIEHYTGLIKLLAPRWRVVCFDMPGFGFSALDARYDHSLDQGAAAVIELLDALGVAKATLAFSCANGFYALRVAQRAPHRVDGLLLSQTPSLAAMHRWAERTVPAILRRAIVGQLLGRLFRQRMAAAWYRIALPKEADAPSFLNTGRQALRCGGCFSLAGVVQGLLREPPMAAVAVAAPITLLWGDKDRSHRLTDKAAIVADTPQAQLIAFEGCGHFPDLEDPARFALLLANLQAARA